MDLYGRFYRPKDTEDMLFTTSALKVTPMQRCERLQPAQMLQYPSEMKAGRGDMITYVEIAPDRWSMDHQLQ